MMTGKEHNYYRSIEETSWPLRLVTGLERVPNIWDDFGPAMRATLECGHWLILTGLAIGEKTHVHCKFCVAPKAKDS